MDLQEHQGERELPPAGAAGERAPRRAPEKLALVHGAFSIMAGVWPIFDMGTFQAVTGPKREHWLVKTVGTLLAGVGGVLTAAGMRRRVIPEIAALAMATAGGLAAIDLIYVAKRRISPVYLLDALVQLGFVAAWAGSLRGARAEPELTGAVTPSSP
jgi:hypothetical protein